MCFVKHRQCHRDLKQYFEYGCTMVFDNLTRVFETPHFASLGSVNFV